MVFICILFCWRYRRELVVTVFAVLGSCALAVLKEELLSVVPRFLQLHFLSFTMRVFFFQAEDGIRDLSL